MLIVPIPCLALSVTAYSTMCSVCFSVYEPSQYRLMQTNVGHTDAIRCIIHIVEKSQVS